MTDATFAPDDFIPSYAGRLPQRRSIRRMFLAAVLVSGALAAALTFGGRPDAFPPIHLETPVAAPLAPAPPALVVVAPHTALLDPVFLSGSTPVPLERSLPLGSNFVFLLPDPPASVAAVDSAAPAPSPIPQPAVPAVVASVPLPLPRPAEDRVEASHGPLRGSGRQAALRTRAPAAPAVPPDRRSFFERLFGMAQPAGPTLAYAAPEDGALGNSRFSLRRPLLGSNGSTAVYNIAAHTVYMPDGTRLEAHSGLGALLDDPRSVHERNRGATPPNVYDLGFREQLFHGVQALRLTPIGGGGVFGRTGLLAHTYMLGPNGDSNGCVSFKDYQAFLQAFSRGEVRRLMVVAGDN